MRRAASRRHRAGVMSKENDVSISVREVLERTVVALGGPDALAAWVAKNNKNATIFWTRIYPFLLQFAEHEAPNTPIVIQLTENEMKY